MNDHTEKPAPITDVLADENAALRSERDLLRDMIRNIHPDMRGDSVVEYLIQLDGNDSSVRH